MNLALLCDKLKLTLHWHCQPLVRFACHSSRPNSVIPGQILLAYGTTSFSIDNIFPFLNLFTTSEAFPMFYLYFDLNVWFFRRTCGIYCSDRFEKDAWASIRIEGRKQPTARWSCRVDAGWRRLYTIVPSFLIGAHFLYTPIQPARAKNCAPIKNEPSINLPLISWLV